MIAAFRRADPTARVAIVFALLFGVAPLAWVAVLTAVVAGQESRRDPMEYEVLRARLDSLLAVQQPRPVFTPHRGSPRGPEGWNADTLEVTGDSARIPSLQEGGLLWEQVRSFNRFQRWRAAMAVGSEMRYDSLGVANPAVFSLKRTAADSVYLASRSSTSGFRIGSPFEESAPLVLVGRGSVRAMALVGKDRILPLVRGASVPVLVDGVPRECAIGSEAADQPQATTLAIWCVSPQGRPVGLAPQALLHLSDESIGLTPQLKSMPVDTAVVRVGDTAWLRPGQLLGVWPLEPLLVSQVRTEPIVSSQWINGRRRRVLSREARLTLPFDQIRVAASPGGTPAPDELGLALDVRATRELHEALVRFIDGRQLPVDFASVLVLDARTGQVVAFSEVGGSEGFDRIRSFEPVHIGSAVKPLLAAAILSQRPELGNLTIPVFGGTVLSVMGQPTRFESELHCARPQSGRVDLTYFLRCSDNNYAANLLFHALAPKFADRLPAAPGGDIPESALLNSDPALGLLRLYGTHSDQSEIALQARSTTAWSGAVTAQGRAIVVPPSLYPQNSSPALVARGTGGTNTRLLAQFAFGGWENRWTLPGAVEAFTRILTDRRVSVRLHDGPELVPAEDLGLSRQRWYSAFVQGVELVGIGGTASGTAELVHRAIPGAPAFYSKTGTLGEVEESLFLRSYLFAIGKHEGKRALGCGLTGIVYFRFTSRPGSFVPRAHLDFFQGHVVPVLGRNWERLGPCP